jgi:transcriptional regulator with XRE-family HTH domain
MGMSDFTRLVGEKLRTVRLHHKLSQQQVAEKTGFSDSYISDVERGQRNISLETLEKFILALQISPNDLFNFQDINVDNGVQEKRLLLEIHKSQLMAREVSEVKYVIRSAQDFMKTVDELKDQGS